MRRKNAPYSPLHRCLTICLCVCLSVLLSACNQHVSSADSVQIDPALTGKISVEHFELQIPGTNNAAEAIITLRNLGNQPLTLDLEGQWLDSQQNFQGGYSTQLELAGQQQKTVTAVGSSSRASSYQLQISEQGVGPSNPFQPTDHRGKKMQVAIGYGMTFSEYPEKEQIPQWTPRGEANGAPFVSETVFFRQDHKGNWQLEISDRAYDPHKGVAMARLDHPAVQTVYINLPEEPQAGAKLHQAMQYGGGYFQIKAKRDANSTTSWNTSLAYHIEFSEWQHGPLAVTSCGRRAEGKASGKLYISFKGSGMGVANSWLAGVFNDAPVLYCAADQ